MTRPYKPVTTGRGGMASRTLGLVKSSTEVKFVAASVLSQRAPMETSMGSSSLDRLEMVDLSAEQVSRIEEICLTDSYLPLAARDAISKPWKASRG